MNCLIPFPVSSLDKGFVIYQEHVLIEYVVYLWVYYAGCMLSGTQNSSESDERGIRVIIVFSEQGNWDAVWSTRRDSATLTGFMRVHNSLWLLLLLMTDWFESQLERFGSDMPSHRKLLRLSKKGCWWWRPLFCQLLEGNSSGWLATEKVGSKENLKWGWQGRKLL